VVASIPVISPLKEKREAVGRGGELVGEARWSARLPRTRKEGGGEVRMVVCGGARPGCRLSPA
jgi:hypothetical protein